MKKTMKKLIIACLTALMLVTVAFTGFACGESNPKPDDPDVPTPSASTYTYNALYSGIPGKWSPHTWEDNDENVILSYISMGLYDVALNDAKNGYVFVPEMAAEEPVDVTADYVGKFGVKSGDSGKAWKIALNQSAVWENGTAINADTYVYSMKELLNPLMMNRRSDSYTTGTFQIFGASDYLHSAEQDVYVSVAASGYDSIADAIDAGEKLYVNLYNFYGAEGATKFLGYDAETDTVTVDENVVISKWMPVDDETVFLDPAYTGEGDPEADGMLFSVKDVWDAYSAYFEVGADYADDLGIKTSNTKFGYTFEGDGTANGGVGLVKTGDYEIVVILTNEVTLFEVHYNLGSNWIVYKDLYEKCKTTVEGLVTSAYCTTRDTTISYGPYTLDKFNAKQYFTFVQNKTWYGYTDGNHVGQYQTTNIDYTYNAGGEARAIARSKFMSGEVDDYSVQGDEMDLFGHSEFLVCEPQSYTYQFFLGTNLEKLKKEDTSSENHSVLSLASFRKAISYAINRTAYCNEYSPASKPGFGVLNEMYVIDPDTGATYRDTDAAKGVSLKYSGFTDNGDGTWSSRTGYKYNDIDSAYASLTGYDPDYAAQLFAQAYDEAKAAGIYNDAQDVVIYYGSVNPASDRLKQMVSLFDEQLQKALEKVGVGHKFKSIKLEMHDVYSDNNAYWTALQTGEMDLSFSAWGGSAFDPFGIIYSCYVDPANSLNYGFDSTAKATDVSIDVSAGDVVTGFTGHIDTTLYDLSSWLANNQDDKYYTSADNNLYVKLGAVGKATTDFKVKAMAVCELAQLEAVVNIPIYYSYVNSLHSAKYNNGTDTYVQLIGFGGIRHLTYNYDDAGWKDFVRSKGGNLEDFYKAN